MYRYVRSGVGTTFGEYFAAGSNAGIYIQKTGDLHQVSDFGGSTLYIFPFYFVTNYRS